MIDLFTVDACEVEHGDTLVGYPGRTVGGIILRNDAQFGQVWEYFDTHLPHRLIRRCLVGTRVQVMRGDPDDCPPFGIRRPDPIYRSLIP